MRSPQIVRLQQQFLASLHSKPRAWLLDQILPAPGFSGSEEVLGIYLHRAMARTVDPLNDVFKSVRWALGDASFAGLLERFYADSFGEPLNAQALAVEFGAFIGSLDEEQMEKLAFTVSTNGSAAFSRTQALVAAAMLDWRTHWVSLIANHDREPHDSLHRKLKHRSSLWLRPRLDRCSRLCISGVDLECLYQLVNHDDGSHVIPLNSEGPRNYLVHADLQHQVVVRALTDTEDLLLRHCDGTHTLTSLEHEASFFGVSSPEVSEICHRLIDEGVITNLQDQLI